MRRTYDHQSYPLGSKSSSNIPLNGALNNLADSLLRTRQVPGFLDRDFSSPTYPIGYSCWDEANSVDQDQLSLLQQQALKERQQQMVARGYQDISSLSSLKNQAASRPSSMASQLSRPATQMDYALGRTTGSSVVDQLRISDQNLGINSGRPMSAYAPDSSISNPVMTGKPLAMDKMVPSASSSSTAPLYAQPIANAKNAYGGKQQQSMMNVGITPMMNQNQAYGRSSYPTLNRLPDEPPPQKVIYDVNTGAQMDNAGGRAMLAAATLHSDDQEEQLANNAARFLGASSSNPSASSSAAAVAAAAAAAAAGLLKPSVVQAPIGGGSSLDSQQQLASSNFHDNEFPSLTANRASAAAASMANMVGGSLGSRNAGGGGGGGGGNRGGTASAYANLIRQPETRTEFQIHNEDFPALPSSQESKQNLSSAPMEAAKDGRFAGERLAQQQKRGVQTHPDGSITNIPAGMLNDQFGMVGLVACLRAIESDPSIIPLALGHDLTTLGLNLNAVERNLYQNFAGPWVDTPCRPQDIDYAVPPEYLTNAAIADKLAPVKLNRYTDDLLFYLFYNFGGEMFQLAAAAELYNRDWRYHKEEKCWLTRASGQGVVERTATHERGTYFVFDATLWRKVPKDMTLEYDKLEDRPMLPPQTPIVPQQAPHNS